MKPMNRYCFALDLIDEARSISRYRAYHKNVWPEITKSIKNAGIINLEILFSSQQIIYDYGS